MKPRPDRPTTFHWTNYMGKVKGMRRLGSFRGRSQWVEDDEARGMDEDTELFEAGYLDPDLGSR